MEKSRQELQIASPYYNQSQEQKEINAQSLLVCAQPDFSILVQLRSPV